MEEFLEKLKSIRNSYVVIQGQYVVSIYQLDELIQEIETAQQQVKVEPEVKPVYGHKRTAKQFFIEQYQEGKCEDITTNPYPEFNNAFYLNIYKLMEDYSKSV